MVSFSIRKINSDCELVAQNLKKARQERGLKIAAAAAKTKISTDYLAAIESGDISRLPEGVYRRKIIKEYADFLGVDCSPFFDKLSSAPRSRMRRLFVERSEKYIRLIVLPKVAKNVLIIALVAACFIYLENRFNGVVSPPALAVENPKESMVTDQKMIVVSGSTEPETEVLINGKEILSGMDGNFHEPVNLRSGMNTITIVAKKKFGKVSTIVKQILVKG
jgi:cytoskeletal protein RodZ